MFKQAPANADITHFSSLGATDLLKELGSSIEGLSNEIAMARLEQYGPNSLDISKRLNPVLQFLALFLSPLPLLLIGLSFVTFITGGTVGALVIALMVLLSTGLAFLQEFKSNKAAEKLKSMVSIKVTVLRNGVELDIPFKEVVPGDVVKLSAGDLMPADLRLLSSNDLFVNQSSLTGESMPVEKFSAEAPESGKALFDLPNVCFMGSHVVSGLGLGVVLRTATQTQFGQLAIEITSQKKVSSFDQGIKRFIWLMIRFMVVMVPLVFFINGFVKGDWLEALLFATAVAVGLTPEMLPMLVTVNLAKGAIAMSRKRVIVKRLNSIQNLGAMDVLCTDKTGTLTRDEIILERYVTIDGKEDDRVLDYAYLNSHYQSGLKNLLDVAVLKHEEVHQKLHSTVTYEKIDEVPFDFQRRRMSVVIRHSDGRQTLICKGAVDETVSCCSKVFLNGDVTEMASDHQTQGASLFAELSADGFRVIAVAIKELPTYTGEIPKYSQADEVGLTLMGYVAFLDPPKETAKPAIALLRDSGISIKVLTGDNEWVTKKICTDVGLQFSSVMLGPEVDACDDLMLAKAVKENSIYARMTPQQKSRVIQALQAQGHVVGYLGDGINDGPGLKVADVSVSVDTAVDIAKESADIILLEKSLLVLQQGVLEGRKVFGNIMKYIKMSASSNFGNMFSMIGASAMLPFLPMAPVQILLNNLLYDFSQTAVPTDYVDEEYLSKPRAWDVGNIARYMLCIGPISSLFDYATFGWLWFVMRADSLGDANLFQTGWFVESLLSQTLIVHIIRTGKIPFIQSRSSWPLLFTTIGICIVGAILPYTHLSGLLQMQALPAIYWYGLIPILLCYLALTQLIKSALVRRFGVT